MDSIVINAAVSSTVDGITPHAPEDDRHRSPIKILIRHRFAVGA